MIFFGSIFEFLLFLYLADNYFKINYPEQHTKFIIDSSYNLIYYFSFVQIKITKLLSYLSNKYVAFIKSNPRLSEFVDKVEKKQKNTIEYISNNSNLISHEKPEHFNFIIYSDFKENTNKNNKLILHDLLDEKSINYEITKYNFILCEITIGDKVTKIDFKTDNYNFMIVNNKIDALFVNYFMKKYYNYEDISDVLWFDYKIKILDQNVNEVILDTTKEIVLGLENYEVKTISQENVDSSNK
jgi:hypothetical protein